MTKGPNLQKFWNSLPKERQKRVTQEAAKKLEAYRSLQELRKNAGLTQAKISERLNIPQGNISRLEKNSDMLLSTLQNYIEAAGGKLQLTVELPNQPPVPLTGLSDLISDVR